MTETTRDRAIKWLIEHNHHACHVDVYPHDVPMPLPTDVDSLAALLDEVHEMGRRDRAAPDKRW